ncbi:MAG: M1 family metallopeptidase [Myxococcales bacterium]|nr:M1 family metallopeptidase [Myxococcales bacterium]
MSTRRSAALRRGAELGAGVLALAWAAGLFTGARPDAVALGQPAPPADRRSGELRGLDEVVPVVSYDLEARLDPEAHTVEGSGSIRWTNTSERPVRELWVHLYMNAFAHERTVFRRDKIGGFRGSAAADGGHIEVKRFFVRQLGRDLWTAEAHTPGDPDDATDIRVELGQEVAPGASLDVELAFATKLPSVVLRAGYAGSFHMVSQWFPKVAKLEPDGTFAHFPYQRLSEFYADFADYRVVIDVPQGFVVGATGAAQAVAASEGRARHTFEQRGVHDFAFAAWDRFQERTRESGGVELRCLFPPGLEAAADAELEAAARGLAVYGEAFGAYPYRTLTIVHPPDSAAEAGGMEYPTLITTGGPFWLAHAPVLVLEHLTLHELAHQWFYGLVATNENAFPFLDEGLTTYATGEALRRAYGHSVTSLLPLELDAVDRATRPGLAQAAPIATSANGFATGGDYGGLVYARAATVLRTIDRVWDGAALRAVGAYAREHRFGHPGPLALEAAIREAGGDQPAAFFHRAVFERGWVDFEPASLTSEPRDEGGFRVNVTVRRRGDLEVPVALEVLDEGGGRTRIPWNGRGTFAKLTAKTGARAVAVVVDPDNLVLVDEDRSNDALRTSPASLAPRALTLGALLGGLALTVAGP